MNEQPFRGDTVVLDVYCPESLLPLTGASFASTIKRSRADTDVAALARRDSPSNGITIKDAVTGHVQVIYPASSTDTMPTGTPLPIDVQIKTADGNVHTVFSDTITFQPDVTRRTSPL